MGVRVERGCYRAMTAALSMSASRLATSSEHKFGTPTVEHASVVGSVRSGATHEKSEAVVSSPGLPHPYSGQQWRARSGETSLGKPGTTVRWTIGTLMRCG